MRKVCGFLNVTVAAMLAALLVFVVSTISGGLSEFDQEPEDLLLLLCATPIVAILSGEALLVGRVLLRARSPSWISMRLVARIGLGCSLFLLITSLVGFVTEDPSTSDFRLLIAPAGFYGWSYAMIARVSRMP